MKNLKQNLLCLLLVGCGIEATDGGNATDGISQNEHRVFVTTDSYDGNLGGLAGADAKCATTASDAGLVREYKAILSDESTSAEGRLFVTGPIYLVTDSGNDLIAGSESDLWGSSLLFSIDIDVNGDSVGTQTVWTGTTSEGGAYAGSTCSSWTTNDSGLTTTGFHGSTTITNGQWVESGSSSCSTTYRLYCISQ